MAAFLLIATSRPAFPQGIKTPLITGRSRHGYRRALSKRINDRVYGLAVFAGVVLGVGVLGQAPFAGVAGEGVGVFAAHLSTDGDQVGCFAGGGEDFRMEVGVFLGDGGGFFLGLVAVVVGEGDDAPWM